MVNTSYVALSEEWQNDRAVVDDTTGPAAGGRARLEERCPSGADEVLGSVDEGARQIETLTEGTDEEPRGIIHRSLRNLRRVRERLSEVDDDLAVARPDVEAASARGTKRVAGVFASFFDEQETEQTDPFREATRSITLSPVPTGDAGSSAASPPRGHPDDEDDFDVRVDVSHFGLVELLQSVARMRKSAEVLYCHAGGPAGVLVLHERSVVHAVTAEHVGEDALFSLLGATTGEVLVRYVAPTASAGNMSLPIELALVRYFGQTSSSGVPGPPTGAASNEAVTEERLVPTAPQPRYRPAMCAVAKTREQAIAAALWPTRFADRPRRIASKDRPPPTVLPRPTRAEVHRTHDRARAAASEGTSRRRPPQTTTAEHALPRWRARGPLGFLVAAGIGGLVGVGLAYLALGS